MQVQPVQACVDVTVAVCTRDRGPALRRCLQSMARLVPAPVELLVIDNNDQPTVAGDLRDAGLSMPGLRVVHEPRRGLDRARHRAMQEAACEVVAFTDDDCEVDPAWVGQLAGAFADPDVGLATGRVVAANLAPGPPQWFEDRFSFDRGSVRRSYDVRQDGTRQVATYPWQLGTGANMALRRHVYARTRGFDPLLDMGTSIGGGGDLDVFAQVLDARTRAVYVPTAIVRHHHRTRRREAVRQFHGYGRTVGALVAKYALGRKGHRRAIVVFAARYVRDTLRLILAPGLRPAPRWLLLVELSGILVGAPVYLWVSRGGPR